jgi:molybdopterin biosynthesis enzyme
VGASVVTGALSRRADAVVMVGDSVPMDAGGQTGGTVSFAAPARLALIGCAAGTSRLASRADSGRRSCPLGRRTLASWGHQRARVPRPRVTIVVTGDELVNPAGPAPVAS